MPSAARLAAFVVVGELVLRAAVNQGFDY